MAAQTPSGDIPGGPSLNRPGIGHNGGPTLNPALRSFWTTPARNRVLYGGRSSSKSWDAAGFAVFLADNYKIRFLCVRQFQNKIEESVYTLLKVQIERFGLGHRFKVTDNKITNLVTGSEFIFYGLWRHIDEIKSLEGVDVCWIEEAHNLTEGQWKILEPTLRNEASQFWIVFNPRLKTDFVYRKFITGTPDDVIDGKVRGLVGRTIKRKINYDENPFLSATILDVIATHQEDDPDDFKNVYLGEPEEDDDRVIIKRSWILAAIGARAKLGMERTGRRRIGFDVADDGKDKNATIETHGIEAFKADQWKGGEDELLLSATRVHSQATERGADIDYDDIGVGAFAGSKFEELNQNIERPVRHYGFNAGGGVMKPDDLVDPKNFNSPTNKDYYLNLKAQAWWGVSTRFRNTYNAVERGVVFEPGELISIDPDIDHLEALVDELSTPRRDFDTSGKVKVESKKDLAKPNRIGGPRPSPNLADAFIMANAPRDGLDVDMWEKLAG